jgi:hypothetical protein
MWGAVGAASISNGLDWHTITFTGCSLKLGAVTSICMNGVSFGGAPSNNNSFLTYLSNTNGTLPPVATTTWSISDHFNAFHDVDFWNDDTAATQSFVFLQRTAGAATTLMALSPTGTMALPGTATGTPTSSLCLDASSNIVKKTTTGSCI